tara:strand:+ start:465 stop:788 length:324 start_codon:yes stop_codon:yes gene_type:complete
MAKNINNLNFIATYIFQFPGCSASEVRRALYIYRNKSLDDSFSERRSYVSYFQQRSGSSHRGYAGRLWTKVNRTRWILTEEGLHKIDKRIIKKVNTINKKLCRATPI